MTIKTSLKAVFKASVAALAVYGAYDLREKFIKSLEALTVTSDMQEFARVVIADPRAFPVCHAKDGRLVRYFYDDSIENYRMSPAYAAMLKDKDTGRWEPYIGYTGSRLLDLTDGYPFAAEHECAHHKLGHTELGLSKQFISSSDRKKWELDADCEAAREVKRKYSYDAAQLKAAMKIVIAAPDSADHPGGAERYAHALRCLESAP